MTVGGAQGAGFLVAERGVVQAAEKGGQLRPDPGNRVQQRADLVRAGHNGGIESRGRLRHPPAAVVQRVVRQQKRKAVAYVQLFPVDSLSVAVLRDLESWFQTDRTTREPRRWGDTLAIALAAAEPQHLPAHRSPRPLANPHGHV